MNFGENLKNVRRKKGLSQRELAEKMGITQQAVAQYEKIQDTPKTATVQKIADALGCNIYSLIDGGFGALDSVLPANMQGANLDGAKVDKSFLDYLLERLSYLDKSSSEYKRAKDNIIALAVSSGLTEYNDKIFQSVPNKAEIILQSFGCLNDKGQDKAIEQVDLLTKIPEYQKKE